jgi:hypothetical protein
MVKTIVIRDMEGEHVHPISTNYMRADFSPKIGTVVITDLRLGSMPTDLTTRATFKLESMVVEGAADGWSLSDTGIKPYSGIAPVFYLVVSGDRLLLQT